MTYEETNKSYSASQTQKDIETQMYLLSKTFEFLKSNSNSSCPKTNDFNERPIPKTQGELLERQLTDLGEAVDLINSQKKDLVIEEKSPMYAEKKIYSKERRVGDGIYELKKTTEMFEKLNNAFISEIFNQTNSTN